MLNNTIDIIWKINNFITIYLNNFILNNHLEKIIWFFSDSPIFFLPIFFWATWLFFRFKKTWDQEKKWKKNILLIIYSIISAMILNWFLKIFIVEHRPEKLITPILQHIPDNSFPSDHATISFSFLFALYFAWYKKTFWIFLPFVIFMNFSRIAWWMHWFFDIFVWMILWLFSAIFIFKSLKNKIFLQKTSEFILNFAKIFKL